MSAPIPSEATPRQTSNGYLDLLRRNTDFRRLYIATLISLAGDWFLTVALLDLVLEISGSATLASLIIVCQSLPIFLVTPFAGHLLDRFDRKRVMVAVDLLRVGAALLPLLVSSPGTLLFAYAGVILISIGAACFDPGAQAALPNMVESGDLARANVLMGSTWGMMLALGAGLGGIVTLAFGRNVSFIVDALTFLVSALLIIRIKAPFAAAHDDREPARFLESLREAFHYARGRKRVLALLSSKAGYGIGAGVVTMLSVFGREVFHAGATGIGILYATRGVGALIGPFIVRGISRDDEQQYRTIPYGIFLFGIGYMALGLSSVLWVGAFFVFLAHLGGGAQWLTSTYGLQREVPDSIRGRVFAADYGLVTLTMSLSSVGAGIAADHFGPRIATAGTATLCLAFALIWGLATRRLWRAGGRPETAAEG